MKYKVYIISDAEKDLTELYHHVAKYDSQEKADHLLDQIESTCQTLSELAHRGHTPPELERIGIFDYKAVSYTHLRAHET